MGKYCKLLGQGIAIVVHVKYDCYMNKTCLSCGATFKTYPSQFERRKYCSFACRPATCKGKSMSEEAKEKMRRNHADVSGENNPAWKSGRRISSNGYYSILTHGHHRASSNNYVYEHVLVVEEKLGRKLTKDEVVHHIDHNKLNNEPSNLMVMTKSEHHRHHANHYWSLKRTT